MARGKRAEAPNGHANGKDEQPATSVGTQTTVKGATIEFARKTLMGDLRDFMLETLRELDEPFKKLSENKQRYWAERIQTRASAAVDKMQSIMAADGRVTITVTLDTVTFKPKGSDAKVAFLGLSRDLKHALVDAQGSQVLIVVADATQYMGARRPAKIDKQEPPLSVVQARDHGAEDGKAGTRAHESLYAEGSAERKEYNAGWAKAQTAAVETTIGKPTPPTTQPTVQAQASA